LRVASRDLARAPGLPPTGKINLTPAGLYPAFEHIFLFTSTSALL